MDLFGPSITITLGGNSNALVTVDGFQDLHEPFF